MKFGHTYLPIEEFQPTENILFIDESLHDQENIQNLLQGKIQDVHEKNIVCRGYFQNTNLYLSQRNYLLHELHNSNDYWFGIDGQKQYIQDFFESCKHSIEDLSEKDVVISLRLDDFRAANDSTSNIIPPEYYLDVLENLGEINHVFIVCDTIREKWEHQYIKRFEKWNPVVLQKDMMHDCALIRDAPILLHSNSTFCWIMSFLSNNKTKTRYIPITYFNNMYVLEKIEEQDHLQIVNPMSHETIISSD